MTNIVFTNGPEIADFVYPVQVVDVETGATLTANNEEEAWELVENCD